MKILFVCRANIFRSQIASALFENLSEGHEIRSAGTMVSEKSEGQKLYEKKDREIELIIDVMNEEGIDVRDRERHLLNEKMVDWADKVICMAERNTIPEYLLQSGKMEYWQIEDSSAGSDYDFFVETKDRIKKKVEKLIEEIS